MGASLISVSVTNPIGLPGNSKSTTGRTNPTIEKLKTFFSKIGPSPRPKVSEHSRGALVMKNVGKSPAMDLKRLYKRTKKNEAKLQSQPQPSTAPKITVPQQGRATGQSGAPNAGAETSAQGSAEIRVGTHPGVRRDSRGGS